MRQIANTNLFADNFWIVLNSSVFVFNRHVSWPHVTYVSMYLECSVTTVT